eukprot:Polyplicarium_translucidae@DN1043_c0_g1_i1.p1
MRLSSSKRIEEPPGNVGRRWRTLFISYGKLLARPKVRIFVGGLFVVYVGVAVYGCLLLGQGLDVRKLAADDSYLTAFFEAQDRTFSEYGDRVDVFFADPLPQWWKQDVQEEYKSLHSTLSAASYAKTMSDGLHEFLTRSPLAKDLFDDRALHERMLRAWLESPAGLPFAGDFVWNETSSELDAWRSHVFLKATSDSSKNGEYMQSIRRDAESMPTLPGTCHSRMFTFYESDVHIVRAALTNMASAAVAVLMVSVLLLPSMYVGVLVVITLIFIDLGVVGFMSLWGLKLNMLTMVNLIISVGFSVDYTAHICHTFCHCLGKDRTRRSAETLVVMGSPILHGALSTQLGVTMLAFASSYVLRVFFKMMTLVLLFGALHGVVFLPVLLASRRSDVHRRRYREHPRSHARARSVAASESLHCGDSHDDSDPTCP